MPWCLNFLGCSPVSVCVCAQVLIVIWWVSSLSIVRVIVGVLSCHKVVSVNEGRSQSLITLKALYLKLPNTDPNGRIYTWTAVNTQYTHKQYGPSGHITQPKWAGRFFFSSSPALSEEKRSHGGWLTPSFFWSASSPLRWQLDGWLRRSDGGLRGQGANSTGSSL